jgi:hypothetical protein
MERAVLRNDVTTSKGDLDALARAAAASRPVTLAREQLLPVSPGFQRLLPEGGLRRGSVVAIRGPAATSLALAVVAAPSAAGSWVGAVGLPSLGLQAADELGVHLGRLVLVASPEPAGWATVVATLLDGVDLVLAAPPRSLRPADARRLHARARDRGAVLVVIGGDESLEADVVFRAHEAHWEGLDEGAGYLRARQVEVEVTGRRAASRPRRAMMWLPDPSGLPAMVEPEATIVPFRGAS